MPLYDFKCPACGHVFEDLAGINDMQSPCPNCLAPAARSPVALLPVEAGYRADAPWVSTCTVPFDSEDKRSAVREYLANPADRAALVRACRAAGIRHLEEGEGKRPPATSREPFMRELVERSKARQGLI